MITVARPLVLLSVLTGVFVPQRTTTQSPDELYRHRGDPASAERAADLWAREAEHDFEAAWKLARACYWLGTQGPAPQRRARLDRGVAAGETAVRLGPFRPEGHFWLAANMGRLAQSFGLLQGLKYRGRIKDELEQVLAIDPGWQGGSADAALGEWYGEVPRLFGGNRQLAEQHLRRALAYDATNLSALLYLGQLLSDAGRSAEARATLERLLGAPEDTEWLPEARVFKSQAADHLKLLR